MQYAYLQTKYWKLNGMLYYYMTPLKDLLWLAETSFDWLWQILMCTSVELNLAQDR